MSAAATRMAGLVITLIHEALTERPLCADEGAAIATATTDAGGNYCFSDLGPGTYYVQEVVPAGYVQTAPGTPGYYTVTARRGHNVASVNVAIFQLNSISGRKYTDETSNGV